MRRFTFAGVLLSVLAVGLSQDAWGQKKSDAKVVKAGNKEFKLLAKFKDIPAELRSIDTKAGKVVVRIENTSPTKDKAKLDEYERHVNDVKDYYQKVLNLKQQIAQHQLAMRNPRTRPNPNQNPQNSTNNLVKQLHDAEQHLKTAQEKSNPKLYQVTTYVDFDLDLKSGAPLRKSFVSSLISTDKLAKYKGSDKTLPGYTATADDFSAGVHVKVYLEHPKATEAAAKTTKPAETAAKTAEPAKTDDAAKTDEPAKTDDAAAKTTDPATATDTPDEEKDDPSVAAAPRPLVRMIMLQNDPPKKTTTKKY